MLYLALISLMCYCVSMKTERFNYLSWEILKHKVIYYKPSEKYNSALAATISDAEYDAMEIEYLGLCLELGRPNTLVHKEYAGVISCGAGMLEVDESRPSVQFMIQYLTGKKY